MGRPAGGDDRRAEVVRRVAAFCRAKGARATIVFDGHPLRHDMAAQDLGAVSLRVPPPGEDADTVIRELVERAARPAELIVVTSDKALYSYVKTLGAAVLRAHEWNALERQPGPPRPQAVGEAGPRRRHRGLAEALRRRRGVNPRGACQRRATPAQVADPPGLHRSDASPVTSSVVGWAPSAATMPRAVSASNRSCAVP